MASIRREFLIDAHPDDVWAAVRDFGAVDRRLAPGFVIDARLDGDARIVTFHNGTIAREPLVDCDDERRRLVYAVISERVKHYNASVQVVSNGETGAHVSWIVDVLPNDIAPYIASQMDLAVLAMQKALASTHALTKADTLIDHPGKDRAGGHQSSILRSPSRQDDT
jgi:polyketide cyclase/dehydrase/lipid transport protein